LFVLSYLGVQSFLGVRFASLNAFIFGTALLLVAILGKVVHTTRVSTKVILKSVQAIGLAFMFFPVLVAAAPIVVKLFLVLMLWTVFNTATGATKIFELGKTCGACKYKGQWGQCPGFKRTLDNLIKAGFLTN
jgi:hypothetical protein